MDRYTDNVSPEPTTATALTGISSNLITSCYKTPDAYQQFQQSYINQQLQIGQFYPTPPSDNEDSCSSHQQYTHLASSITPLSTSTTLVNHRNVLISQKCPEIINIYSEIKENFYSSIPVMLENTPSSSSEDANSSGSVNRQLSYKDETTSDEKQDHLKEIESIFAPGSSSSLVSDEKKSSRYKRRSRTCFTKYQLDVLEATFQRANYPDIRTVDELSDTLNLSTERISIWFQNRRARFKKAKKLVAKENRPEPKPEFIPPAQPSYTQSYPAANYPTTNVTQNTNSSWASYPNDQSTSNSYFPNSAAANQIPFYTNQFYQYPQFYQSSSVYSQPYSGVTYQQTSSS